MSQKTQGVYELVRDVLRTLPEPYGEDVIEEVCLAIENNPDWRKRYEDLARDLRYWVVNNWIGQYTKILTGLKSKKQVAAKRSKIIKSYSKLMSE